MHNFTLRHTKTTSYTHTHTRESYPRAIKKPTAPSLLKVEIKHQRKRITENTKSTVKRHRKSGWRETKKRRRGE